VSPSKIRSIRKALGLSVNEFAEALGFNGPNRNVTVYRWECGLRTPSQQTMLLIRQLAAQARRKVSQ
jgi:DNA-binding transcriptional regulator YiaG